MNDIKQGEKKFYIGENQDDPMAEINYVPTGATQLIIDHTYVSDELRGQGVGEALVERVVSFARAEEKKVIPLCPFAKRLIEKNTEYQDVL